MDLYASIHKALRSFMTDTLRRIGRIDVADRGDRDAALDQLYALLGLCLDHLRHENEFIHAGIEARQPAGSRRVADEHVEHAESIAAGMLVRSPDITPAPNGVVARYTPVDWVRTVRHGSGPTGGADDHAQRGIQPPRRRRPCRRRRLGAPAGAVRWRAGRGCACRCR